MAKRKTIKKTQDKKNSKLLKNKKTNLIKQPKIKISPSILSANFMHLGKDIKSIQKESDYVQVDVMDGIFVENISFGQEILKDIKTPLVKDVHLMIDKPERYVKDFAKAGSDIITIHAEATNKIPSTLKLIRKLGCKAGLAIKPNTSEKIILKHKKLIDLALVMTVEPGFGGQKFIKKALPKITRIRKAMPNVDIEVDGGIDTSTIYFAAKAGANVFVSGSTIFKAKNKSAIIKKLRMSALKGQKDYKN